MSKEKKTAIILGAILGIAIVIIAIFVFKDKEPKEPETGNEESSSLFDEPIFDMDRGYIEDDELLVNIRETCFPYANNLTHDTVFYTTDGNELYTNLLVNDSAEVMIYVNLETKEITYELKAINNSGLPGDALD